MRTTILVLFTSLSLLLSGCSSSPPLKVEKQQPSPEKPIVTIDKKPTTLDPPRVDRRTTSNTQKGKQSIKTRVSNKPVKSQVKGSVLFGFDQYHVTNKSKVMIERLSSSLKSNPSTNVVLEGHTDKTGKTEYNKALSLKRAKAVQQVFTSFGVPERKIKAVAQGEEEPIEGVSNKRNRRVEIIFNEKVLVKKSPIVKSLEERGTSKSVSIKKPPLPKKESKIHLVEIKAGFDNKTPANEKIKNTIPWYPVGGTKYLEKDVPIIVAGISKDGKKHTATVEITLSVDRHTKYIHCITWFCSKDENDTDTYTKVVQITTYPKKVTTEKAVIDGVELEGMREGNIILYQGKRVTVKDARVDYKVLDVE